MYLLLSGEGPTDLGTGLHQEIVCEGEAFQYGPMALLADQIIEGRIGYSPIESGACGLASKQLLEERASDLRTAKKAIKLPGAKRERETLYYYNNARSLARLAIEKQAAYGAEVIAILFRDTDGTASAERGEWAQKRESIVRGFEVEGYGLGVPMIPKPKSEAWLICALKAQPYQGCAALEERSGNDDSPNSLKKELEALGYENAREPLCELVQSRAVDFARIDMLSFRAFRNRLEEVVTRPANDPVPASAPAPFGRS